MLATIVALAAGVAANWALRVPFFQNPDEAAHADYAFALYDAGVPFTVPNARAGSMVMPQTRYLARVARYRAFRYNTRAVPPPNFGTRAYFASVDAGAPKISRGVPAPGSVVPYVMFSYPPLYYALVAVVMTIAASLTHDSLTATFFSARLLSVAFLAGTIVLAFYIFRATGRSRTTSLLATAAVAFLPLTSSISASIQPDTFATLIVNATLLIALRLRRGKRSVGTIALLALALTCLTFVKAQYALALCLVCAPLVFVKRERLPYAAALVLPLLGFVFAPRLTPVGSVHLPVMQGVGDAHAPGDAIVLALRLATNELRDIFFGGVVSEGFWMRFGFRAGSAYGGAVRDGLVFGLSVLSLITIALVVVREWLVLAAIARIARRRSLALGAELLFSGVLIDAYVVTTALLVAVYVATSGQLVLQGRYWFPILVPSIALTVVVVPRLLRAADRRRASLVLASAWAAYAIVSVPSAIAAREYDYYATGKGLPARELGEIQSVVDERGRSYPADAIEAAPRGTIALSGYAIDAERGAPARRLIVEMPAGFHSETRLALRSYDVYRTFNDPTLMRSGFAITIAVDGAPAGTYRGRILEIEDRAPRGLPIAEFTVTVAAEPKR